MAKAKTQTPAKRGRPSKFTPEIADEICERLANGEPLAKICRDEHMPDRTTVRDDWAKSDPVFSQRLAGAREDWHDSIAHRARNTARGDSVDGDSKGDVQRDKLIIDTDMKLLACWDRARYGTQKVEVDHSGSVELDATKVLGELGGLLESAMKMAEGS